MRYDFRILSPKNNNKFTIKVYNSVKTFKQAVSNVGYFCSSDSYMKKDYVNDNYQYIKNYFISIREKEIPKYDDRGFFIEFYAYSNPNYRHKNFEDKIYVENSNFISLGYTDATRECEDMVLKIMYQYLKIYPSDAIMSDYGYIYTKDELEKIINSPYYDINWCYKENLTFKIKTNYKISSYDTYNSFNLLKKIISNLGYFYKSKNIIINWE